MAGTKEVIELASQSAQLSSKLYLIDESVRRSSADVESIANEIAGLSTVLWRLHEAMILDPKRYTEAFRQDLEEILQELGLIFLEIEDVATELERKDGINAGTVSRFFKKARVQYLQKYLETLRTTLAVMKNVLQHGCEYSPTRSPQNLLTSDPHTLLEEHAILDCVYKNNRNAIEELHVLDEEYQKARSAAHNHHRRRSSGLSDIPEFPPVPDAISPSKPFNMKVAKKRSIPSFSRRGVRLAVHMSILDMGAHSAPDTLKNKWIQTSRTNRHSRALSAALHSSDSTPFVVSPTQQRSASTTPLKTNRQRANSSPLKRKGLDAQTDNNVYPPKHHGYGILPHTAAEKLHKVIDKLDISASSGNRTSTANDTSNTGISKLVPNFHKKKTSPKQELLNAFPAEVPRRDKQDWGK